MKEKLIIFIFKILLILQYKLKKYKLKEVPFDLNKEKENKTLNYGHD